MRTLVIACSVLLITGCATVQTTPAPVDVDGNGQQGEVGPKPDRGVTVWAIDITGAEPPEILVSREEPLSLAAMSPDGRYLLFLQSAASPSNRYEAVPHLLDREQMTFQIGSPMQIRSTIWSGDGFWTEPLVHLGIDLSVRHLTEWRDAFEGATVMIAAAFSPDGTRMAMLLASLDGKPSTDLIITSRDGANLVRLPDVVMPVHTERGLFAEVSWSPDGTHLALVAAEPRFALIDVNQPDRANWTTSSLTPAMHLPVWSPDSASVWLLGVGMVDQTGQVVLHQPRGQGVWNHSGNTIAFQDEQIMARTNTGQVFVVAAPSDSHIVGFLPNGRLVVTRTKFETSQ